jgi:nicotinate dehydrogenase subunit B
MHGISDPGNLGLGNMPGFKDSLNDQQMKDLVQYLRARFAPDKPQWEKVEEKIAAIRQQPGHP